MLGLLLLAALLSRCLVIVIGVVSTGLALVVVLVLLAGAVLV